MLDTLLAAAAIAAAPTAILFGHLVQRRRNAVDAQAHLLSIVTAERNAADDRADRSDRRARAWESFAWQLWRLLQAAGIPTPEWPTDDRPKVPA